MKKIPCIQCRHHQPVVIKAAAIESFRVYTLFVFNILATDQILGIYKIYMQWGSQHCSSSKQFAHAGHIRNYPKYVQL